MVLTCTSFPSASTVLLFFLTSTSANTDEARTYLPNESLSEISTVISDAYSGITNEADIEGEAAQRESFSFSDMYRYFDCIEYVYNTTKPLYTQAMWKQLRDLFEEQSDIDMTSSRLDESHVQNYRSGYSGESKGRGTFAARNFTKGELVHDGAISTVFWMYGGGWREYVMALPQSMACDVLEWTWIQEVEDYGPLLCLNLNDAAFMNHDDQFNIAPKDSTSLEFYAVRDITEGKELTQNYDIYDTDWELFEL